MERVSNNGVSSKTPKNGVQISFLNLPLEPEDKSDHTGSASIRPRKDFFNNLSKEGQKCGRLAEYAQIKHDYEVEGCTFKPSIINDYVSKSPTKADKLLETTLQKLPVHEKLNLKAKEKDEKILKTYEETKKWRELKDCTFVPKINKEAVFKNKRKSNSAQGLRSDVPQMDPYYQKLNDLFGKKSLDTDLTVKNPSVFELD